MTLFQAFILGVVQGITEFIPISSSGHLVVFPKIFGWDEGGLSFDTTLHLGTLTSLLVYFFNELKTVAASFLGDLNSGFKKVKDSTKLLFWLVVSTIPAGVMGFLLEGWIESKFRSILSVAMFLLLGSFLMYFADKTVRNGKDYANFKSVFVTGLFQCLALFPGFSRSGATISGGLLIGYSREFSAKISFLLSIFVIAAAGISQLPAAFSQFSGQNILVLIVGFLSSASAGYFSVYALLKYLKKNGLKIFIIYRLLLAVFLVFLHFF